MTGTSDQRLGVQLCHFKEERQLYFLITIFSVKLTWLPFVYESNFRVADLATLAGQAKHSALPLTVLALFNIAVLI